MTPALLITLLSPQALAGACCVGSTSPVPLRLGPCEKFMAGMSVQGEGGVLRWDGRGGLRSSSLQETGVEATLALGAGLSRRAQLGAMVPIRHTWRSTNSLDAAGGGVGDVRLIGRYNLGVEQMAFGQDQRFRPGVWVTAGARVPTGRAWTEASDPLLADVTGLEKPALTLGLIAERTLHKVPWVASISSEIDTQGVVATAQAGVGRTLGQRWTALGAVGHTATVRTEAAGPSVTDRTWISGRLVVGRPVRWRGWLGLTTDLPIPGLGREQALLTRVNVGAALIR